MTAPGAAVLGSGGRRPVVVAEMSAEQVRKAHIYGTCTVANDGCKNPAGYRIGNGISLSTPSLMPPCSSCGQPVCGNCSSIVTWYGQPRQRVCANCLEEKQRHAPIRHKVSP